MTEPERLARLWAGWKGGSAVALSNALDIPPAAFSILLLEPGDRCAVEIMGAYHMAEFVRFTAMPLADRSPGARRKLLADVKMPGPSGLRVLNVDCALYLRPARYYSRDAA